MAQFQGRESKFWRLFLGFVFTAFLCLFCFAEGQAQTETEGADATISFIELGDQASDVSPEDIQEDGSFEALVTLRNTVLENGKTYADWEELSRGAKIEVALGTETTETYEELRLKLVEWRDLFLGKESVNASQISTINGQLSALTINTTAGTSEEVSELVTLRIAALEKERAVLRVPSLAAGEAFALATGLIREIDRIINSRKRQDFLEASKSPLWPTFWADSAAYLYDFMAIIPSETRVAWHKPQTRETLISNLPKLLFSIVIAGLIFLRWGRWSRRVQGRIDAYKNAAVRWIAMFSLSTASTVAPLIAVALLINAVLLSGLFGSHGIAVVEGLMVMAIFFLIGRWLGQKIFPRGDIGLDIVQLSPAQCVEGRLYSSLLGVILSLSHFVIGMFNFGAPEDGVRAVLSFPLILGTGLVSYRLAQLFRKGVAQELDSEGTPTGRGFRNQVVSFASGLVMVPAVLGPLCATVGYFNAASMITIPLIPSLGLLAFLLILHKLSNTLYDVIVRRPGASQEAIIPVLFGFFLALASLPIFAIILGVRPAQVFDFWSLFVNGFTFGSTRISPTIFLLFLLAFGAGYAITRLVQGAMRNLLLPKTKMDIGGQNAVVSGLGYVGILLAGLAAITVAGIDLSALAIVAGALSVGIGFGLQNIVSNFVSGIILLVERPISEGDWIETSDGQMGIVRDISVRSTRIETFDRTDVIIPNGDLVAGVVTNWTRGNSIGRLILSVGVAYDSDSKQVEKILLDVAKAHPMVLASPAPSALFRGFGASSLDFELRIILRDINWKLSVHSELNHEILKCFNEAGISIPFPQSDLWIRNPEELSGIADDGTDNALGTLPSDASAKPTS